MNKLIVLVILMVSTIGSFAQDNRTLDTKVADVLAQMPTKNLTYRDKAMDEVLSLGQEGFQKLAEQLTPPGVGDDTAVRFAINSFARYASQFGKCEERAFAEENILIALKAQTDTEVKTFLLNQLNLVGSEKCIPEVAEYLTNAELCEPATQTLVALRIKKVAKSIMGALPSVEGKNRATLVRALGVLKCQHAVDKITPFVNDDEQYMKKTALAALANIGAPDSYKTLLKAAKAVGFKYEATNAAEAFLNYTNRLGEQNEIALMEKACKEIFKANESTELLHNYSTGLAIYTKYLGYKATPLLLDAVDNGNKPFRYSALNLAEKIGGIADTRAWIAKADDVNPEIKADIISMLGRRGDKLAAGFIEENLNSTSTVVREEVIAALGELEGTDAIPALTAHLATGNDLDATKATLVLLIDKNHLAPVAAELDNSTGKTKAACIDVIAAKAGTQYFDEVYATTASMDADEKAAAFSALKNVSTEENLDKLLELLLSVDNETEIAETQMAVVAAAKGVEAEQKEGGKIFTALKTTNKKARVITILPEIGGDYALETVTGYFNTSTGETKNAAFDALLNWKDYSASKSLYEICKTSTGEYQQKAFVNFVRMVGSAKIPDDQKLLQYRKIMSYANSADDKSSVITSIGKLKTFLSMIYLEQFLDDKELQQAASISIMRIALPKNNQNNGFSGEIVRNLLEKAKSIMTGDDSQYFKIDIENYLAKMPKEKGFVPMFNGKNLDGWKGLVGNPISRAEMSKEELAKKQAEADAKVPENWSVKDGKIVFNGKGHNLCSVKDYADFELIVDWLITKEGDSGIYLRGTPQVQIWDTSRVEVGAQVGSGGLYNNNKDNVRDPLKVADNPIDEWNTFRITMIGENVTVYLNGELVVDNVKMDNYWNREIPIFESGAIELQAHGNQLQFRDIYVREINTEEIGLTEEEKNEGFVSLFNGKNLDGWQGNKTDYYAKNGELVVNPKMGGHGNLFTEKEYSDFIFRFEFQLTPGANNGLGIRAPLEGDAAYVGMELQILDNTAPVYANLHEYQYHGSVYGVIPAKRGFQKPVGEWNTEEVIVKGSKVKVVLNGEVILDGDIVEASKNGTLDHNSHPGLKREKGYIGFLGHGSKLKFRNIRVKDLSK
jgi:HEAT repeat protein